MTQRVDVVVLGLGPGGEEVAGKLAEAGLNVIGVEKELVGGECPYWGCVPSKMMIRGADLLAEGRRIPGVSGTSTVVPDWSPVARRIRDEATDNWNDKVAVDRLTGKGGHFVRGAGRITGPGRVDIGGETYEAARGIVIATGAVPVIPPIPGLAGTPYWTNRDAVKADPLPASMAVLGGGAIGAELAQAFSRFGVRVTVIEGAPKLVPLEEPEAGEMLAEVFRREGIEVVTGSQATEVRQGGEGMEVVVGGRTITAERLLVATGRRPNTAELGLETIGIEAKRGIPVDGRLRAGDRVWALGDVTGLGAFTHLAMYHAGIIVADILGSEGHDADHHALPRVTFTDPEIGSVGLSELGAREKGLSVRVGTSKVAESARGWIHGPGNEGFIKLVEDSDRGVLVGATSAGPWGGEVLSMLCLAVHAATPVKTLREMIYAYPTFHRGIEDALRDLASK